MNFPKIVLGTMYHGSSIDRATSFRMLDIYADSGNDLIDTANNYAFWITGTQGGESESLIGEWLAERRPARMRIATKVGARPRFAGGDLSDVEGLSELAIRRQIDGSLQRLGIDTVDLLYAHIDDHTVPFEESLGTLNSLVEEGKARSIGLSNLENDRLTEALRVVKENGFAPIQALQQRYSVIPPVPGGDITPHVLADENVRTTLAEHNIPLLAYSPLVEGGLGSIQNAFPPAYESEANRELRTSIAAEGEKVGKSLAQVALIKLVEEGVTPVVGARTSEQVASAIAAFD